MTQRHNSITCSTTKNGRPLYEFILAQIKQRSVVVFLVLGACLISKLIFIYDIVNFAGVQDDDGLPCASRDEVIKMQSRFCNNVQQTIS